MNIRIGSTRPAKVDGARAALDAIARLDTAFAGYTLETFDLTHIAPRQPMSLEEIIDGARTRASALLTKGEPPDARIFAIGVEGGLHETAGLWALHTWAAVTDRRQWGYGAGPAITLPEALVDRVRAGDELGDVIDAFAGEAVRGTRGAWGVLTRDLIGRRDAFRLAVSAAFAPFYNAPLWAALRASSGA